MTRNEWPRRRAAPALLGSFTGTLYGCLEWVAREARRLGVIETRSLEEELILRLSERWYALAAKVFAVVQNTFEIHAFLATPRHGSHAIEGTATEGPRAVSPENARELLRQQPRFGRFGARLMGPQ
jgi:hypothetical protein